MAQIKEIVLRLPSDEIADRGTVRLGSGTITGAFPAVRGAKQTDAQDKDTPAAGFPALRLPSLRIADRGLVRLGSGTITAGFPSRD